MHQTNIFVFSSRYISATAIITLDSPGSDTVNKPLEQSCMVTAAVGVKISPLLNKPCYM